MSNLLSRFVRRLRALLFGSQLDRELDVEMRHHIDLEAADIAARRGVDPDEARRQAAIYDNSRITAIAPWWSARARDAAAWLDDHAGQAGARVSVA